MPTETERKSARSTLSAILGQTPTVTSGRVQSKVGASVNGSDSDPIRRIQGILGARYGGMWIEGDAYSVAVVLPTQADAVALANAAPVGATVRVLAARYSYAALSEFAERVSETVATLGLDVTQIGPDPRIGRVVITVSSPNPDLEAAIADSVPVDAFTIDSSGGRWLAAEPREQYPPYRGGRSLFFPANGARCSAGIAFISNSSGLIQGTTAGHCARDGWAVNSGGAPNWPISVGVTNLNVFLASNPAFGDAQLIGPTNQNDMTRRIFEDSLTFTRQVTDKFNNSDFVAGVTNVCKTGLGGGTTCGNVTAGYPQIIFEQDPAVGTDRQVRHLVFMNVTNGCFP